MTSGWEYNSSCGERICYWQCCTGWPCIVRNCCLFLVVTFFATIHHSPDLSEWPRGNALRFFCPDHSLTMYNCLCGGIYTSELIQSTHVNAAGVLLLHLLPDHIPPPPPQFRLFSIFTPLIRYGAFTTRLGITDGRPAAVITPHLKTGYGSLLL